MKKENEIKCSESYVKLEGIYKKFNHVLALENSNIEAKKGEVLAIVGDNGAGKSTLIKVLSGVIKPDSGTITVGDNVYKSLSVDRALEIGISTVYQDLALGNTMDVASNIFLGHELTKWGILRKKEMHRRSKELLERLEINIPNTYEIVGNLSGGQRQGVAVARIINHGGNVLIFDEPTAAMGIVESENTLKLIRSLADMGMVVIIISHNLAQVFQISDSIAVMRHGTVMLKEKTENMSMKDVVTLLTSSEGGIKTEKSIDKCKDIENEYEKYMKLNIGRKKEFTNGYSKENI